MPTIVNQFLIWDSIAFKFKKAILSDFPHLSESECARIEQIGKTAESAQGCVAEIARFLGAEFTRSPGGSLFYVSNRYKTQIVVPVVSADELILSAQKLSEACKLFRIEPKPRRAFSDTQEFLQTLSSEQKKIIQSSEGLDASALTSPQQNKLFDLFLGAYISDFQSHVDYFLLHFRQLSTTSLAVLAEVNAPEVGFRFLLPSNKYFVETLRKPMMNSDPGVYPATVLQQPTFSLDDVCEQANTKDDRQKLKADRRIGQRSLYCAGIERATNHDLIQFLGKALGYRTLPKPDAIELAKAYPAIT